MISMILVLLGGIALGYALRRMRGVHRVEVTLGWTVWVLLFVLGVTVGALSTPAGQWLLVVAQAVLIGAGGVAGTLLAVAALRRWLRREEAEA